MKFFRLFKTLFSILILLILIIGLSVAALFYFVNPNSLKPLIADEIKKRTGYQLSINGALSWTMYWSLYPRLAIKVEEMTLKSPKEVHPFLDLRQVKIAMDLSALVRGKKILDSRVAIGEIILFDLHAIDMRFILRVKNEDLKLESIKATLYQGFLEGNVEGTDLKRLPRWHWDIKADDLQIQPLLEDMSGGRAKLKLAGKTKFGFIAQTEGNNKAALISHLNGTYLMNISNGLVHGVDFNYFIRSAVALLNKQPLEPMPSIQQTAFDHFSAVFAIKNGIAQTNDMQLSSSDFTINGVGLIGIQDQNMNFKLNLKPTQQIQNTIIQQALDLRVKIEGDVHAPKVSLDLSEIEKHIAKEKLEEAKTKLKEKIKERIPGKIGDVLQQLIR